MQDWLVISLQRISRNQKPVAPQGFGRVGDCAHCPRAVCTYGLLRIISQHQQHMQRGHHAYRDESLSRQPTIVGAAENDGHENDGPSKCPGMKLTDMKMQDMFQVSE